MIYYQFCYGTGIAPSVVYGGTSMKFVLTSLQEDSYRCKLYSDNYLVSDEEATRTVCSFKQTSYVAQMIGGIITNIVINYYNSILCCSFLIII